MHSDNDFNAFVKMIAKIAITVLVAGTAVFLISLTPTLGTTMAEIGPASSIHLFSYKHEVNEQIPISPQEQVQIKQLLSGRYKRQPDSYSCYTSFDINTVGPDGKPLVFHVGFPDYKEAQMQKNANQTLPEIRIDYTKDSSWQRDYVCRTDEDTMAMYLNPLFESFYDHYEYLRPTVMSGSQKVPVNSTSSDWSIRKMDDRWHLCRNPRDNAASGILEISNAALTVAYPEKPTVKQYRILTTDGTVARQGALDSNTIALPYAAGQYRCELQFAWNEDEKGYRGTVQSYCDIVKPQTRLEYESKAASVPLLKSAKVTVEQPVQPNMQGIVGEPVTADGKPLHIRTAIYKGASYVPVNALLERFQLSAAWDANARKLIIGMKPSENPVSDALKNNSGETVEIRAVTKSSYTWKGAVAPCMVLETADGIYIDVPAAAEILEYDFRYGRNAALLFTGRTDLHPAQSPEGKYGYIDSQGKWVILPQYTDASDFYEGLASVSQKNENDDLSFLDRGTPQEQMETLLFRGPLAGVIDASDQCRLLPQYGNIGPFKNGYALCSNTGTGTEQIRSAVSSSGVTVALGASGRDAIGDNGLFAVKNGENGLFEFIDNQGNSVIPSQFTAAKAFHEGLAAVRKNGKWGYIDAGGTLRIPYGFSDAGSFSGGLAAVAVGDGDSKLYGYIDENGKMAVPAAFSHAGDFSEGWAFVQNSEDGTGSYINRDGVFMADGGGNALHRALSDDEGRAAGLWGDCSAFREGRAVWKSGNDYGYVDTYGNIAIPCIYDAAEPFCNGLALTGPCSDRTYLTPWGKTVPVQPVPETPKPDYPVSSSSESKNTKIMLVEKDTQSFESKGQRRQYYYLTYAILTQDDVKHIDKAQALANGVRLISSDYLNKRLNDTYHLIKGSRYTKKVTEALYSKYSVGSYVPAELVSNPNGGVTVETKDERENPAIYRYVDMSGIYLFIMVILGIYGLAASVAQKERR